MWKILGYSYEEKSKIYMIGRHWFHSMVNIGWLKIIEESKEHAPLWYEIVALSRCDKEFWQRKECPQSVTLLWTQEKALVYITGGRGGRTQRAGKCNQQFTRFMCIYKTPLGTFRKFWLLGHLKGCLEILH